MDAEPSGVPRVPCRRGQRDATPAAGLMTELVGLYDVRDLCQDRFRVEQMAGIVHNVLSFSANAFCAPM